MHTRIVSSTGGSAGRIGGEGALATCWLLYRPFSLSPSRVYLHLQAPTREGYGGPTKPPPYTNAFGRLLIAMPGSRMHGRPLVMEVGGKMACMQGSNVGSRGRLPEVPGRTRRPLSLSRMTEPPPAPLSWKPTGLGIYRPLLGMLGQGWLLGPTYETAYTCSFVD